MKKTFVVFLVALSIVGVLFAQQVIDITTTVESSATDLSTFGTQGASKVIIWYSMPDSTDTLWTRVTGAARLADTFANLDANSDTTKYSLEATDAWAFGIVVEDVPPFMKIEIDSLAYTDGTVSDKAVTIRTQLIF